MKRGEVEDKRQREGGKQKLVKMWKERKKKERNPRILS